MWLKCYEIYLLLRTAICSSRSGEISSAKDVSICIISNLFLINDRASHQHEAQTRYPLPRGVATPGAQYYGSRGTQGSHVDSVPREYLLLTSPAPAVFQHR